MSKQEKRKAETRTALLEASGKAFRSHGFAGVGVDAIAGAAGATSGAFYAHLKSKDGAFLAALEAGLDEVIGTIPDYRQRFGENWTDAFARYYLGAAHRKDLACGCAMTALSPDVIRANGQTRELYDLKMRRIAELIAAGLQENETACPMDRAWAYLSVLIGALTVSRAMADEKQAERVTSSALPLALAAAAGTASEIPAK